MQKPGTSFRHRILPHHVFQPQCILDALTVSRGWSLSFLRGHVLEPPAAGFRPRRDVDLFLDRQTQNTGRGYIQAAYMLKQVLEEESAYRPRVLYEVLDAIQFDFINWLGESKYQYGLNTIPPSRFAATDSNGLWEYSPFPCGVGLTEGLDIAYSSSMFLWDAMPEPMLLVHIHNMLVQKGYIERPIGLYHALEMLFPTSFFRNGKAPTSDFISAFTARVRETGSRRTLPSQGAPSDRGMYGIADGQANGLFKQLSNIAVYRRAQWNVGRIPDSLLPIDSMLAAIRLGETRRIVDAETGRQRLADTELTAKARASGMDEQILLDMASHLERLHKSKLSQPDVPPSVLNELKESTPNIKIQQPTTSRSNSSKGRTKLSNRELLSFVEWDVFRDVSGSVPLSGISYIGITIAFMMYFDMIEDELKRLKNPVYTRVCTTDDRLTYRQRINLGVGILAGDDEECLVATARVLEQNRSGLVDFVYWGDVEDAAKKEAATKSIRDEFDDPFDDASFHIM
ncbi:hypothetical protein VFPPC_07268 [Pochonia chlamydosporia 170]|uniref:Uncharacterized protein n=1 Tax=Pochonia chlamydosporia 170 TaxID=1380566 RepID=A0A179F9B6_METCM|nr:hypothetical protein VFPPC_07268 [Pochonia chlamydosporia 170]OAQ62046.1 hypothetical protein VFPPC_07268 [Pochonia chlamydosporia 170]